MGTLGSIGLALFDMQQILLRDTVIDIVLDEAFGFNVLFYLSLKVEHSSFLSDECEHLLIAHGTPRRDLVGVLFSDVQVPLLRGSVIFILRSFHAGCVLEIVRLELHRVR